MPKRTRNYDSWLLKELIDPFVAANYINAASEDSDEMLLIAMRNVAEAHRMSRVAEEANVNRESLYKTLSSGGNPRLENFRSILDVLGLKILVAPKEGILEEQKARASGAQIRCSTGNTFETAARSTATGFVRIASSTNAFQLRDKPAIQIPWCLLASEEITGILHAN